jgi:hypothetical protein
MLARRSGSEARVDLPEARTRSAGRAHRWLILAGVAVTLHVVAAWLAREPGILTGQDDAEYIALAQSLRQGGYRELYRVDAPLHRTYPPGYPAALAVWGAPFGDSFDALVALNVLLSAAALVIMFVCLRRLLGAPVAALATAVLALNPVLVAYAGSVRSEPLYIVLTLLCVYAMLRAEGRWQWLAVASAAALLAAFTRTIGVTLLAALALHWLLERRWKLVGIPAAIASFALAAWLGWTALDPEQYAGASYIAELRSLWRGLDWTGPLPGRAVTTTLHYVTAAIPHQLALPTVAGTRIDNMAFVLLAATLALAGWLTMLRHWRPAALYMLVYAGLLAIWLYAVDRFMLPLLPFIVAAMFAGVVVVSRLLDMPARSHPVARPHAPAFAAALAVLMLAGAAPRTAALVRDRMECVRTGELPPAECMSADQASWFEAVRHIRARLPEDAVLLTAKYATLWLYTGRRSISYEAAIRQDTAALVPWLQRQGADWILLGSLHVAEAPRLAPLLQANCDRLVLEAFFPPRTYLFRVRQEPVAPGATRPRSADACASLADYRQGTRGRQFGAER